MRFACMMGSLMMLAIAHGASADEPPPSRLLVVAPRAWCAALESFARAKQELPWIASCQIIALETLCDGNAGDEAEQLKRGLFARWQATAGTDAPHADRAAADRTAADRTAAITGIDAVLLIGDGSIIPMRYMMLDRVTKPAFDVAFYPSDLYYANLAADSGAFNDWNARTDGHHAKYIGEVHGEANKDGPIDADRCGLIPQIAVGRWPVHTLEQMRAVADKTIAHDRAVLSGRLKHTPPPPVAVVACQGWIDNAAAIETTAQVLERRHSVVRLLYCDADEAKRPSAERIADALAQGRSLIVHTGHGNPSGWEHGMRSIDLARNADAQRLPVIVSIGCSTAEIATLPPYQAYRDSDGIDHPGTNAGEIFTAPPPPPACRQLCDASPRSIGVDSILRATGGAVVYIGCDTGSQPCAQTLLEGFAQSIGERPTESVGASWMAALARYVHTERLAELKPTDSWYPPSIYFQPMKFVLLGDPTARIN